MKVRKMLAILLSVLMVFTMSPVTAFADTGEQASGFADMPDNWSTTALHRAVDNGLLKGYEAGGKTLIKADAPLKRAEMAAVVNRAFGATETAELKGVNDVSSRDWYAKDMAQAVQMGTFVLDRNMRPESNITRQEAFTVLARAFKITSADTDLKALGNYSDKADIAAWAQKDLNAMAAEGYIKGSPDGKLNPKAKITRAEFAAVMDSLVKQYIDKPGEVNQVASAGNVMVRAAGVALKGVTIKGDLIIADGVGDGEAVLDGVKVEGRVVVRGGGVNSIIIRGDSSIGKVVVARADGAVRIAVEGGSSINYIYVDDGSDDIIVTGNVGTIEVVGDDITVTVTGATIENGLISGDNSRILVERGSEVSSITIGGANVKVSGQGVVKTVKILENGDNAAIITPNTRIDAATGADGVTGGGGAVIKGGTAATNNNAGTGIVSTTPASGGGGGGGSTAVERASTYKFIHNMPKEAVEGKEVNFDVTFKTNIIGTSGYENVYLYAEAVKAEGEGAVAFEVKYPDGYKTFTNKGTWEYLLSLPADYGVTRQWELIFSKAGEYTITFSLITIDSKDKSREVVAGTTETVHITVKPAELSGDLTFRVSTPDGPDIEGAKITIDGKSYLTDKNGNVFIKLKRGYYEYTVEKEGYEFRESSVIVGVTTHETVYFYPIIKVSEIIVIGEGDKTTVENGKTLSMVPQISPAGVTNKAVTWSVESGTGDATIDENGLLIATKAGTVTVKATAKDGSGVSGTVVITITAIVDPPENGIVRELPALAYDEDKNRYLVAYKRGDTEHTVTETGIYGRFVLPDGSFSGEEFVIAPSATIGTFSQTAVSYDSKLKRFLVVWDDARDNATGGQWNLYGQFVSAEGVPLEAVLPISDITDGKEQTYPGIAFDSTLGNFLIIYNHEVGGSDDQQGDLHCRLLKADRTLGEDKRIAGGQWNQSGTSVDFNGTDFLVAYGDQSDIRNKVKLIDSTGTPSTDAIIFTAARDGIAVPQLVYNTQLEQFLAVWSTRYVGTGSTWIDDICGSIVQKGGSTANHFVIADQTKLKQFYPDVAAVGDKFAVVWMDAGDSNFDIRAAIVSTDKTVSEPIEIAKNVGDYASPTVCGGKDGALAAYEVQIGDDLNIKDIQVKKISTIIPVESIIITGAGDATTIVSNRTLQMIADVTPTNAATKTVTWSVASGPGTISDDGLLTPTGVGVITVKATAQDGSGVEGTKVITVETDSPFFTFDSTTGTITGYDNKGGVEVVIPSMIDGVAVTSIGYWAFRAKGLTSVTIPNSVTSIGERAFSANSLTGVTIPNSVISIGDHAFDDNFLTSVTIPNSVTSIGEFAFSANKLSSLTIPNSVTSVGVFAFSYNLLTSVTIPDSVETIDRGVFQENQLTSVTIPDSVITIRENAFTNNQLNSIVIGNQVTTIGKYAFNENQLTSIIIPGSVKTIEQGAFFKNVLTSITIGDDVDFSDILVLSEDNGLNFRNAYVAGRAGRYIGTQEGTWAKQN